MVKQVITLLGGRVRFIHAPEVYKPTSDAVWVASAVETNTQSLFFEAGFGTGAAGLCLIERYTKSRLIGLELQTPFVRMAHSNILLNNRGKNISLVQGDVRTSPFHATFMADHSLANPPFYTTERGFVKQRPALHTAHGLTEAPLTDWLDILYAHTRKGGTISLINHTDNLDELLNFAEKYGLQTDCVHLITSEKRPAKRAIMRYHVGITGGVTFYTVKAYDPQVSEFVLRRAGSLWDVVEKA